MTDLARLSHECADALRDAEAHGATVAAEFLRVKVRELFRIQRAKAETEPLTRKPRPNG